jgi:hypothetical protein
MYIKERIMDNLINKIINIFPNSKTKYGIRLNGNKAQRFSFSKHKTKSGRQYAKFCKIYFGTHKK